MAVGCGGTGSPDSASGATGETMTAEQALSAGYLRTPFGLVHPSCIHTIDDESTLHADATVHTPDGRVQKFAACQYARVPAERTSSVEPLDPLQSVQPLATTGWTAATWYTAPGSLGYLSTTFKVPKGPSTASSQTLFFFPSFKPAGAIPGDGRIIQPVLQWGPSAAGGGQFWSAASWELDNPNGVVLKTTVIRVSAGDTISGIIQGNTPCPSGACQSWSVITKDTTTGQSKTITDFAGFVYKQANSGVLEQYKVNSCAEYPNDTGIVFSSVVLKDSDYNVLTPTWTNTVYSNISPQCNFAVTSTSSSATIAY